MQFQYFIFPSLFLSTLHWLSCCFSIMFHMNEWMKKNWNFISIHQFIECIIIQTLFRQLVILQKVERKWQKNHFHLFIVPNITTNLHKNTIFSIYYASQQQQKKKKTKKIWEVIGLLWFTIVKSEKAVQNSSLHLLKQQAGKFNTHTGNKMMYYFVKIETLTKSCCSWFIILTLILCSLTILLYHFIYHLLSQKIFWYRMR